MKKRNLRVPEVATVERNSHDVAAAVVKLLPKRPAAMIQIGTYAASSTLVKEMRKGSFAGMFCNVSFVGSQALADALDKDGVGIGISQVVPFPWSSSIPVVAECTKTLEKAGIKNLNFSSLGGHVAAKVFVQGLKRVGPGLIRERLIFALESINRSSYDVGGFDVSFSRSNHNGSKCGYDRYFERQEVS